MKAIISFFALAVALTVSANTHNMSCVDVQELVDSKGETTLWIGNQGIYDRFHAKRSMCNNGEKAVRGLVKTADSNKCFAGYVCKDREYGSLSAIYTGIIRKCKDGQRAQFSIYDSSSDRQVSVWRTCKDGRYWPRSTVTPKKCVNGRRGSVSVVNNGAYGRFQTRDGGRYVQLAAVCSGGKYVPTKPYRVVR